MQMKAHIFQCVGKEHIRCVCVHNGETLVLSEAYAPEEWLYNMCNH